MTLTIAGGGGTTGAIIGPTYKSGDFITAPSAAGGGVAASSSTLYLSPIFIPRRITCDQIAVYVTTGVAATTARLGIYVDDGAGRPAAVLIDGGTAATTTTSTVASVSISQVLTPGVYWTGCQVEGGTPGLQQFANQMPFLPRPAVNNSNVNGYSVASRTGALTTAAGASLTAAGSCPIVFLRVV